MTVSVQNSPINAEEHLGLAAAIVLKQLRNRTRNIPIEDTEEYAEACLALMRAVQGYNPDATNRFSTYAVCAIRHQLANFFKQEMRYRTTITNENELDVAENDEKFVDPNEILKQILSDYPEMPESERKDRDVLKAHYLDGKTLETLSHEYGVSKERIKQRVHRALQTLRKRHSELLENYYESFRTAC